MLKQIAQTLPTAAQVTQQLLEQYGPDRLWQIARIGPRLFQGWLTDGRVILATVEPDDTVSVREIEAVY